MVLGGLHPARIAPVLVIHRIIKVFTYLPLTETASMQIQATFLLLLAKTCMQVDSCLDSLASILKNLT